MPVVPGPSLRVTIDKEQDSREGPCPCTSPWVPACPLAIGDVPVSPCVSL